MCNGKDSGVGGENFILKITISGAARWPSKIESGGQESPRNPRMLKVGQPLRISLKSVTSFFFLPCLSSFPSDS